MWNMITYPEGHIGANFQYLFNHNDIEKVLFKGYETKEFHSFIHEVAKAYGE